MPLSSNLKVRGAPRQLIEWARTGKVPPEVMICGPRGTGKSVGIWAFILWVAETYQGCRILICRQTRASITQSVLVTLEKILGHDHPALQGPSKEHRTNIFIGRSEIVFGSLENPDRLYSTEWDIVWVEEAREISRAAWEKFIGNMRNFVVPFQLMLASTNPDAPGHWLYQRWKQRKLRYLKSLHIDNPEYYESDGKTKTEKGEIYLSNLRRLTGTEYKRNYLGEWVAAEGAVFPDFDPELHMVTMDRDSNGWVTADALSELEIVQFYGGCDFGFDAPGSLSVYGFTRSRKWYRVAQVYRTRRQLGWWADRLFELHEHYPLELLFCDPSRPDAIEHFNDKLMVPRYGPGAIAVKADNDIFQGLQVCRDELDPRQKGGPRILFDRNALYGGPEDAPADESRFGNGLPTATEEEIPAYIYERKALEDDDASGKYRDKPDPSCHDHGCDDWRYRAMGTRYFDPPPRGKPRRAPIRPGSLGDLFGHEQWLADQEERDAIRNEILGIADDA